MSNPFPDVSKLASYAEQPLKQLNLGWTIIRIWNLLFILVGILLLVIAHIVFLLDSDYKNNNKSKTGLLVMCFIGWGLLLVGLVGTISNFYDVVNRINIYAEANPNGLFYSQLSGAKDASEAVIGAATAPAQITRAVNNAIVRASSTMSRMPTGRPSNIVDLDEITRKVTGNSTDGRVRSELPEASPSDSEARALLNDFGLFGRDA